MEASTLSGERDDVSLESCSAKDLQWRSDSLPKPVHAGAGVGTLGDCCFVLPGISLVVAVLHIHGLDFTSNRVPSVPMRTWMASLSP